MKDPMTNLPTLEEAAQAPGVVLTLPLDALAALTETADEAKRRADFVKKIITAELERRYAAAIETGYRNQGKDTGTVRLLGDEPGLELVVDRAKKVEWAQPELKAAWERIATAGDDPAEYIETSFRVDERKFSAWPEWIRAQFAPARTVKPGATTIKIVAKTSEAA
jgi:hypothetical protein